MGSPKTNRKGNCSLDEEFKETSVHKEDQCKEQKRNQFLGLTRSVVLSAEQIENISRKNKEQWRKILKVFDPVKHILIQTPKSQHSSRRRPYKSCRRLNFTLNASRVNNKRQTAVHRNAVNHGPIASVKLKPSFQMNVQNRKPETSYSSSTDSTDESETITWKSTKYQNPEEELEAFIEVIEKDLRKTRKQQRRITHTVLYSALCKKAISRARADLKFLDYEQRMRIRNGVRANVTEIIMSYGVCISTLQVSNVLPRCFVLDKFIQPLKIGSSLVPFVDNNNYYMVNGLKVFIQPNRIVEQK